MSRFRLRNRKRILVPGGPSDYSAGDAGSIPEAGVNVCDSKA